MDESYAFATVPLSSLYDHNNRVVRKIRTVGNVVAGCVAGLLKASAAYGALIYLTASLLVSLAVMVKTAFQPGVYFASARKSVLLKDLLSRSSILTYILFWTMFLSFR